MKTIYTTIITLFIAFVSVNFTHALTVSPAILEISGDPGVTINGSVKLFNETDKTQTFYTSFENFEPSDDSGTPRFIGNENGLATWFSAEPTIVLESKERRDIPFSITVPVDTEPGGYFSAIFFGTQPPAAEGGTVSIGGRLGVLTLLRVNGDIPEQGGLLSFNTLDEQYFYDMPPVNFEYRFSNDGGDRVVPRGDIEIKNTFGTIRSEINANPTEGSVLPDSARRFKPTWLTSEDVVSDSFFGKAQAQWKNFHFGLYSAQLNLGWGFTNQTATDSVSLLIIPWQLLLIVIAIVIVVFVLLKVAGREYKKALIKQLVELKEDAVEPKQEVELEDISKDKEDTQQE